MTIATFCQRHVVTIDALASLREAAARMREHHVGALVVTTEIAGTETVIGIITDRDLTIDVLARNLNPSDVKVGQLASRHLASVPETAGIAQAIAVMKQTGVRRLLVIAAEGRMAGFVAADDLLEALADQLTGLALALRSGIARESAEKAAIAPVRQRPVFLAHGTPGMQQPVAA